MADSAAPSDNALVWFTPLPPARNGIADYSRMLLEEIVKTARCRCFSEDPLAQAPQGVEVCDPAQAFRHIGDRSDVLHQIGNNPGHIFALKALRRFGGVSVIHDLSLLYLHELASPNMVDIFGLMRKTNPRLGDVFARHWRDENVKTPSNYILFDMLGDVLSGSQKVIVHSQYARRKIAAIYGAAAAEKVAVIPHFAKPIALTKDEARRKLGLRKNELIVLTSGFATKVKRFDWLIEALDAIGRRGKGFRWIHAGEERPSEYSISNAISDRPGLLGRCSVTGYLSEDDLDSYIASADIVVNLRFPSVGESSGTLARAFSAGRCCVVNDTAAYSEIPRDAAVHIPVFDTVATLTRALDLLLGDEALRTAFGARARRYASRSLSISSIAEQYLAVVGEASKQKRVKRSRVEQAGKVVTHSLDMSDGVTDLSRQIKGGAFEFTLWFRSAEHFAETASDKPHLIGGLTGPHIDLAAIRFVTEPGGLPHQGPRLGLHIVGRAGT